MGCVVEQVLKMLCFADVISWRISQTLPRANCGFWIYQMRSTYCRPYLTLESFSPRISLGLMFQRMQSEHTVVEDVKTPYKSWGDDLPTFDISFISSLIHSLTKNCWVFTRCQLGIGDTKIRSILYLFSQPWSSLPMPCPLSTIPPLQPPGPPSYSENTPAFSSFCPGCFAFQKAPFPHICMAHLDSFFRALLNVTFSCSLPCLPSPSDISDPSNSILILFP